MGRTARIFWIHARVGLLAELQYRTDVWARLLSTLILTGASLASIAIVYGHVDSVSGWTREDLVVLVGTFLLLGALVNGIIHLSMAELAKDIKQGTLDFRLLKPVDAQVLALVQKVDPWRLFDVLLGLALCAWGMARGGAVAGVGDGAASVAGGLVLLVSGAAMLAGFWLLVTCVAFWTIQGEEAMSTGHKHHGNG